jgi:hypothetical protein
VRASALRRESVVNCRELIEWRSPWLRAGTQDAHGCAIRAVPLRRIAVVAFLALTRCIAAR